MRHDQCDFRPPVPAPERCSLASAHDPIEVSVGAQSECGYDSFCLLLSLAISLAGAALACRQLPCTPDAVRSPQPRCTDYTATMLGGDTPSREFHPRS